MIAPGCFSTPAFISEPEGVPATVESTPEINDSSVITNCHQAYEQSLAAALHQPIPKLGELPVAQYRFLFDTDKKAPPNCVCTELIHLQADKDNARLLPMQALNVTDSESDQLIEALNDLIRHDGLEVMRTTNHNFYLSGMPASELDTWPAHAVANGKIADYLPRKAGAGDWRRLMTEVQMLFHAHPVNIARAEARQLAINGMWFWGGSRVSSLSPIDKVDLYTTDAYACGLAKAMNIVPQSPADFDWSNLQGEVIVVELGVYAAWLGGDHDALQEAKKTLQSQWITPAQQAVATGLCNEFVLDGCEGQAIIEKPQTKSEQPFWKRFSISKWLNREKGYNTEPKIQPEETDTKP